MADFDASIVAHFGGDTTGLQAAITEADANVQMLETRFRDAGITMGEAPRKFAQESMKAFESIFKAEDQLTTMRLRDDRIPVEQRLGMARKQGLAILEQINAITGTTTEKAALLVEFERKKGVIAELNSQLLKQTTTEVTEQTKQAKEQEKSYGGLGGILNNVKDGFKGIGLSIKGAGIGILLAGVVKSMSEALKEAVATREEFEKMGKPVDSTTASVARLSDALSGIKEATVAASGAILGLATQAGEYWGSVINRMRGISEEQEKIAQSAARNADLLEKQAKALRAQQYDREAVAAATKAANDAEAKAAYERASLEQQHQTLLKRRSDLLQQISDMTGTEMERSVVFQNKRQEMFELENKIREKGSEVATAAFEKEEIERQKIVELLQSTLTGQKEVTGGIHDTGAAYTGVKETVIEVKQLISETPAVVEKVTERVHDQAAAWDRVTGKVATAKGEAIVLQGIIAGIATAKNFGNDPTDVLQERMRRNSSSIGKIQIGMQGAASSPVANNIDRTEIARLTIENQNIKRELDLRTNVARTFATQGRQAAMQSFAGDPNAFDRFLALAQKQDISSSLLQKDINGIFNLLKDTLNG